MPFIWDDIEWLLVDDEDKYDKSRFVVVRKLHLRLMTSVWQVMVSIKFNSVHSSSFNHLFAVFGFALMRGIMFIFSILRNSRLIESIDIYENLAKFHQLNSYRIEN